MRNKLTAAILDAYRTFAPRIPKEQVIEAIKNIPSDTDLAAFAARIGVNVPRVLEQPQHPITETCVVCKPGLEVL